MIAVVALVLTSASLAWACLPQAIYTVSPSKGASGTTATASGSGFPAGPVQIRWESSTGQVLATAVGPNFSVSITIPADTPGTHYVIAGEAPNVKTAPFEVTGTPAPPPGPAQPPPAATGQQPSSATLTLPQTGGSPRAKAIATCERKYNSRRARTAAKKRRLAKKRKACSKAAKRLPAARSSSAFQFAFASPFK
jgi:hypothetical protein